MDAQKDDPVGAALKIFTAAFPYGPMGVETISISECRGRVLAGDIHAAIDQPPFSRALMEGFLINTADTQEAGENSPVSLAIRGKIEPGNLYEGQLPRGFCLEVSTGSHIPEGDYAVVRFMDADRSEKSAAIRRSFSRRENVEAMGCELRKGELILHKGMKLSPREIITLASQGILSVEVARKPRVLIFCSGNEVVAPSEPLKPGFVWDANSYALSALVEEYGGIPVFCGIMQDDISAFRTALADGLSKADMAVIAGGTAAGGREFIADLINSFGSPGVVVNGVPMRSGKPLIMGVVEKKPVVCVAGYPPEAMRGFSIFGKPAITKLLGQSSDG